MKKLKSKNLIVATVFAFPLTSPFGFPPKIILKKAAHPTPFFGNFISSHWKKCGRWAVENYLYSSKMLRCSIWLFLFICFFFLKHFDVSWMFLLLSVMFYIVFCKNTWGYNFHFYDQIKQKRCKRFRLLIEEE